MATPNLLALTTVTPKILASAQLASGNNTIYTVPANKAAKISGLVLANISASSPVIVTVSLVPSGGTIDGTHQVVSNYSIAAGDSTTITELAGQWMGQGDYVNVNAGTAAVVDATMTGIEFS